MDARIEGLSLNGVKVSAPHHVSPLRNLSLESCSFNLRGITQLLSIPTALRSFSYFPHYIIIDHDSNRAGVLGLLSQALSSLATYQRHSLTDLAVQVEGLAEIGSYESSTPSTSHIFFSRLTQLTKLSLTLSEHDRLDPESVSILYSRLPRSLNHFHITDKHRVIDFPWLTSSCQALLKSLPPPKDPRHPLPVTPEPPIPNLTHLTIAFAPWYDSLATPILPRVSPDLASSFAEQGHLFRHRFRPLRSHPVHFTVIRRTEILTAVPPYLWDEERPEEVLVYDNMNPEDMWATETGTEKEKVKASRRRAEENRRRQEVQVALQQLAQADALAAQQDAQAEAFTAQVEGGVTVVSSSEMGLVQGQTNSA